MVVSQKNSSYNTKEVQDPLQTTLSYEEWKKLNANPQKIVSNSGKELSPYVDNKNNVPKKIISGTEAPEVLMPGSPLEGMSLKEENTATVPVTSEPEHLDHIPYLTAGCGFLLGILVSTCFFCVKIKRIKQEFEAKLSEARESLDRAIRMFSTR